MRAVYKGIICKTIVRKKIIVRNNKYLIPLRDMISLFNLFHNFAYVFASIMYINQNFKFDLIMSKIESMSYF